MRRDARFGRRFRQSELESHNKTILGFTTDICCSKIQVSINKIKKACVELGGKDALIILDDADMERALNAATFGSFMHQGQICMSVERIIIDKSIANEFTERFVEKVKTLNVGNPREMPNVIGPIINQRQLDRFTDR